MKTVFSFAYQEQKIPLDFLYYEIPMRIGAMYLPTWNEAAQLLAGTNQTDDFVTRARGVYPGDNRCRI